MPNDKNRRVVVIERRYRRQGSPWTVWRSAHDTWTGAGSVASRETSSRYEYRAVWYVPAAGVVEEE